jgi:hypothetical protein
MDDAQAVGERVEALLAELSEADPKAGQLAEELVTCLVQLYGAGLATVMQVLREDDRLQALLISDPLVESLLLVHDLHPLDTVTRVRRALGRLGAEFAGIDADGVVEVKLGHGCGSTMAAIEEAVAAAAPETTGVRQVPRDPPLLQITRTRPAGAR